MNDHAGHQPMSGRVALVAGASRGIGAATAEEFAAAGAAVVLAARDVAALRSVAGGIEARGGRALAVGTDVTDAASVRHLVERTLEMFGRLDAAFNNATAGPMPAPLADIDPDEFDLGSAANIRGTFLGMKYQIPAMLASGGGAIVNMASLAGVTGVANLAAYVAGKAGIIGLSKVAALDYADQGIATNVRGTFLGMKYQIPAVLTTDDDHPKAVVNMASSAALQPVTKLAAYVTGKTAIIGLTKVAALDYADRGVRANVVAPGPILTHHLQAAGPEAQRLAGLATPMRRTGTVEEVARTVLWLCSPAASFINGAVVPIDGGQTAGSKPEQMYREGEGMSS